MKSLPHEKAAFLGVLAARIVPEFEALDHAHSSRFYAIVDDALQDRTPAVRRQFGAFLGVVRWAPVVRFGVPFDQLSAERQDAVLRWFEDAPVGLLRKGTWGLKAMVFMGYYGQSEIGAALGYRPAFDGRSLMDA